jgi:hypothetical protein
MPSRAEMRVRLEQALRGIVMAVLAVMLWQSLHQQADSARQMLNARGVDAGALAKWSALPSAPSGIHLRLDRLPSPVERSWLGALAGAGSSVTWSGDVPALMIDAQPVASPAGGTRVLVVAPSGSSVVVDDDIGVIDTVRAQNNGAALSLPSVAGGVSARVRGSLASTVPADSLVLRRVLVVGAAGWESKFVVAALEEEGWKVDAFIRIAPGVDVTQGSAVAIDTSRYSAVVALDGTAAPYVSRLMLFVRSGGGVVMAPQAASLDAMAPPRVGGLSRSSAPSVVAPSESVGLRGLALIPLASLRSDAVVIDKRGQSVAIAARRIGAGRALQFGYEDTWRWRMTGGQQAVRDHRQWWTDQVASVAYAPSVRTTTTPGDEAPLAAVVAAVGTNTLSPASTGFSETRHIWMALLFALLALGLVGGVASRRMRGAL